MQRVLEIGCGFEKTPGAVSLDVNPRVPADIHHDLDVFPYPIADDAFDRIIARNILEHVADLIRVMEELHRVARSGAHLWISVPHFSGRDAHTDPTHRRSFAIRSFDYFIPGTELFTYQYSGVARFRLISRRIGTETPKAWWRNPLLHWLNRHPDVYETRFAYLYPQATAYFVLEALKP